MSASMPLAPKRNRCGVEPGTAELFLHQREPLERLLRGADAACGFEADGHSRLLAYSRMARVMTKPTGSVALIASLPVEVLMKSAPAIMATMLARATLRSVTRSPVPRITFMCADPQAALKVATSSNSACQLPPNTWARVMTTSISFAPASNGAANLRDSFVERRKSSGKAGGHRGDVDAGPFERLHCGLHEGVVDADGRHLDAQRFDAEMLDQVLLHRLLALAHSRRTR